MLFLLKFEGFLEMKLYQYERVYQNENFFIGKKNIKYRFYFPKYYICQINLSKKDFYEF